MNPNLPPRLRGECNGPPDAEYHYRYCRLWIQRARESLDVRWYERAVACLCEAIKERARARQARRRR